MKHIRNLAFAAALLLALAGCSTMLSVKAPEQMFISTGDYVEGVKTEGIIQVHQLTWTPLLVLYDASKVRESLYKQLLDKAKGRGGIDGITNISFYQKPSVYSLLAPVTLGLGIWVDNYAEGVVISTKR
jgi:hypothetical protein